MNDSNDKRVFRPSLRAYVKNSRAMWAIAAPFLLYVSLVSRDRPLLFVVTGGAAVTSIAGVLLYMAAARIVLTPDSIGRRGFGPTRWIPRAAVSRTLLVVDLRAGSGSPTHLFLFAPDSALVMRLFGAIWGEGQLRALGDALGVEQSMFADPIAAAELNRLEPTALNWAETHPKQLTWIVVLGFFALATPIAVIVANRG